MTTSSTDWLASRAEAIPGRPALRFASEDVTYAELDSLARSEANLLAEQGVGRGSTISLDPEPGIAFAARLHAAFKLGAAAELGLEGAEPVLGNGPDPVALRRATSGTAGPPRTVAITYRNLQWSAAGSAVALGVRPGDRWLCCLPLRHIAGLSILTRSAAYGTAAVLHPSFDVDRVAESLERREVSLVSLVVTQLVRLLRAGADLSGPRAIVLGGGPVPADVLDEALGRGASVVQSYGMTETCSQVSVLAPGLAREKAGSAGRALLGAQIGIDGGEILVRGPMLSPSAPLEAGWHRTGDLGSLDPDGYLRVEGRLGDMIVTGGENVSPLEVEAVLELHPGVAEAAVVGRPDPEWQEAVSAVVVMRDGEQGDADSLRDHCASRLAPFKVPKRIEFVAALPRTASGKLLRRELR